MDDQGGCGSKKSYKNWIKKGRISSAVIFAIIYLIRSDISPQTLVTAASNNPDILSIVCFTIICICISYVIGKWLDNRAAISLSKNSQKDNEGKIRALEEKVKKFEKEIEKLMKEKNKLFLQNEENKQKLKYMKKQMEELQKNFLAGGKQGSEYKIIRMN